MEPFGVHPDLQEDILDNYTVSASETEQSKQASKTEKKKILLAVRPFQAKTKPSQILIAISIIYQDRDL